MNREALLSPVSSLHYDVSLFGLLHGDLTQDRFTKKLYTALVKKGIRTFWDDSPLQIAAWLDALQRSGIQIPVFGLQRLSSEDKLDKLIQFLECENHRKTVLPIFYDVHPSDVQNQTGSYAEAFSELEERFKDEPNKIRRWRAALTKVSHLSGWCSEGRHESELIKEIVEDVWRRLHPTCPLSSSSTLALPSTHFSSSSHRQKSDVFLSFRGIDTRLNFVDHLYDALGRERIPTFRDDKNLERGKSIASELVKAIEGSKISIVVLSKNYASSTWCLDELLKILQCKETSNIRNKSGILKALMDHEELFSENRDKVKCNRMESSKNRGSTQSIRFWSKEKDINHTKAFLELHKNESKIKAWPLEAY